MRTHIDVLEELLSRIPMVTRDQAALYLSDLFQEDLLQGIYSSIDHANQKKIFWFEHFENKDGEETIAVSRDKVCAEDENARLFPYAFWLYLSLLETQRPCYEAEDPFTAAFTIRLGKEDRIGQVLVYDPKRKRPMILRHEVYEATKREKKKYFGQGENLIPEQDMPLYYWRLMIIVNPPKGFFESRDFQYLRGLGFVKFCIAESLDEAPTLAFSEEDEEKAWSFVMDQDE